MLRSMVRYLAFIGIILITIVSFFLGLFVDKLWFIAALIFGALVVVGISELMKTKHDIKRNLPVKGILRYFF